MSGRDPARAGVGDGHGLGFTLVEMLVSIAVIAVLIGLLAPAIGGARRAAQDVVCTSNCRQLAIAWIAYMADTGHFPYQPPPGWDGRLNDCGEPPWRRPDWAWGGVDWYTAANTDVRVVRDRPVNPYVQLSERQKMHGDIFRCPRDAGAHWGGDPRPLITVTSEVDGSTSEVRAAHPGENTTIFAQMGNSYRANGWVWCRVGMWKLDYLVSPCAFTLKNGIDQVRDPSRFTIFGDSTPYFTGRLRAEDRTNPFFVTGWWHGVARCTMGFLDGSARNVEMEPGKAVTGDYSFWLDPSLQPARSLPWT